MPTLPKYWKDYYHIWISSYVSGVSPLRCTHSKQNKSRTGNQRIAFGGQEKKEEFGMILRRLVLIDKLERAGADKDTDKLLAHLDDDELNRLAAKYGLEQHMIDRVRVE